MDIQQLSEEFISEILKRYDGYDDDEYEKLRVELRRVRRQIGYRGGDFYNDMFANVREDDKRGVNLDLEAQGSCRLDNYFIYGESIWSEDDEMWTDLDLDLDKDLNEDLNLDWDNLDDDLDLDEDLDEDLNEDLDKDLDEDLDKDLDEEDLKVIELNTKQMRQEDKLFQLWLAAGVGLLLWVGSC